MTALKLFTSESVTEGHPDKVCDQISDALLDAILEQDPTARVALETMVTTGQVHVAGELTTCAYIDAPNIIREVINNIGYTDSRLGFDGKSVGINLSIELDPRYVDVICRRFQEATGTKPILASTNEEHDFL